MTHKLYYDDPMKRQFDAVVLEAIRTDNISDVVLDCTCFYPGGGGQPADRGSVDGIAVLGVHKQGDRVIHRLQRPPETETVHGTIDWEHRFDYMQQHTGQHIISAAMVHVGGYNTVAVHQGEHYTTVECDTARIPDQELARIEELANETVCRNLDVRAFDADETEIPSLDLRRPPKVAGTIRIVEIDGFDRVACGGVHIPSSGQVGIIKLLNVERIRGNLRTAWKIGRRALADYREKTRIVNALADRFSAKQHQILTRAEKLEQALKQAQYDRRAIGERFCAVRAGQLREQAVQHGDLQIITHRFEAERPDLFRGVLEMLIGQPATCACLVNIEPQQVQWIIGCSEGVDLNFEAVRSELLPLISGKGGGRPSIWQGVGSDPRRVELFLKRFSERVVQFLCNLD